MSSISPVNIATDCNYSDFVWIGPFRQRAWHPEFEVFSSVEALLEQGRAVELRTVELIVLSLQAEEQDKCLRALRENDATFLSHILVCHESALSPYLANGLWDTGYNECYQTYQIKKQQIKLDYQDDPRYKLLAYLWCHPHAILEPHSVPAKTYLYDYPLLRCFGVNPDESFAWLDALQERLRSVIRVTDACSNYTRDGLLMLLPMTDMSQLKSIYKKLFDLKELQSTSKIELNVKALTLPADIGENVAEWLTDQLLKATPV